MPRDIEVVTRPVRQITMKTTQLVGNRAVTAQLPRGGPAHADSRCTVGRSHDPIDPRMGPGTRTQPLIGRLFGYWRRGGEEGVHTVDVAQVRPAAA
jgi:hypothetical protein